MRKNIYLGIVQNLKRAVYNENKVFDIYPDTAQLNAAIEAAKLENKELDFVFKHFDLWNHNVEFIESETNWETPAVFVQFDPIQYKPSQHGKREAEPMIYLHIVTPSTFTYLDQDTTNSLFDLLELPYRILHQGKGEGYTAMTHIGSQTNHDHEELIESIETFACKVAGY